MRRVPLLADRTPWAVLAATPPPAANVAAYAVAVLALLPHAWAWPAVLLVAVPGALLAVGVGRALERWGCDERPGVEGVGREDGFSTSEREKAWAE